MSVLDAAEEYFSNINPIASRIYADFKHTKNSYECIWNTLSIKEQSQILNECIIKPEVSLKYNLKQNEQTKTNESFANKRISDENCSYRDEHSAPFSFKTLSQVDLRIFNKDKKVIQSPKLEPPKIQPRYSNLLTKLFSPGRDFAPRGAEHEALVSPHSSESTPTCETGVTDVDTVDSGEDAFKLPKTGLDFLDNW